MYRILGTSEEGGTANSNGASGSTEEEERSGVRADTHLHDYDPEIFDDDDFYHQVHTHTLSEQISKILCVLL